MTKSKKHSTITKSNSPAFCNIQYEIIEIVDVTPVAEVINRRVTKQKTLGDISEKEVLKKRVTKPRKKPGAILALSNINVPQILPLTNIIVHLKCSLDDLRQFNDKMNKQLIDPLTYDPSIPPEIKTYHRQTSINEPYSSFIDDNVQYADIAYNPDIVDSFQLHAEVVSANEEKVDEENTKRGHDDTREINKKLKKLKVNLYKSNIGDKRSACFWCTCDFDNESCCIPRYEMEDNVFGYGSFCRPECAAAYLMKENIDDSMKFERYHLLNRIYGKIFNYTRSIKPAPNPYYTLDKFFGNLSIQEYRSLLKSEHLLLVLEKPLTRVLPELHDDNDEHGDSQAQKQGMYGMYKVRRASDIQTKPSKSGILKKHFG